MAGGPITRFNAALGFFKDTPTARANLDRAGQQGQFGEDGFFSVGDLRAMVVDSKGEYSDAEEQAAAVLLKNLDRLDGLGFRKSNGYFSINELSVVNPDVLEGNAVPPATADRDEVRGSLSKDQKTAALLIRRFSDFDDIS